MPSLTRRALLAGAAGFVPATAGCSLLGSSETPAHWVTVYLGDRELAYDVTVTVTDDEQGVLFEREYALSDANEADEDAPFPASSEPESVFVTVDGARFERDWPGFEHAALPCDAPNTAGVELWIDAGEDGTPTVRLEADCQHVTME